MSKTREMVEALETFVIQKVQSFNEGTSPEEVMALAELVRAITILKKVNNQIAIVEI